MRVILTILLFLSFNANALNVKDVAALKKYTGTATEIVVTNEREYGNFYPYTGFKKADGGVIVPDGKGRLWQRMYGLINGVYAGWWGAIGDGKQDALPGLKAAANYCIATHEKLNLPEPIYRVTSPWLIGVMSISASDSRYYEAYVQSVPSYNLAGVISQNSYKPFSIEGNTGTIVWGDFESTEIQPVIFYGLWGMNADHNAHAAELKNLTICGKKGIDDLGRVASVDSADRKNIGLLMQRVGLSVTLSGMQFHGLETGCLINSTYATKILNNTYSYCNTGLFTLNSHSVTGWSLTGLDCGLAFHINSGASVFNQMNTERCERSLLVTQGFNIFNSLYFETHYDGYAVTISDYADGNQISGMTIAGPKGILMQEQAKRLTINSSMFVSSETTTKGASNQLDINNSFTDIHNNQQGKITVDGKQLNPQYQ